MPEFGIGDDKGDTDFHPTLIPLTDVSNDAFGFVSSDLIHKINSLSVFDRSRKQDRGSVRIDVERMCFAHQILRRLCRDLKLVSALASTLAAFSFDSKWASPSDVVASGHSQHAGALLLSLLLLP